MAEEKPSADAGDGAVSATFLAHLIELRNRLFYSVVAVAVAFVVLAVVVGPNQVYALIARPLMDTLPPNMSMIATEVASPFLTPIKFTLAAAVVIAIPVVLYQVWAFVAPGLYQHERRIIMPLLVSSIALFYGGMAFAYFIVLLDFLPPGVQMMTDIKAYLDFVFSMFFAFGVAFEVPVAVVLLSWMGIVNPHTLGDKRPYVILAAFVIAAVLTPPDVLSQFLLAVPMWILFEIGVFIAKRLRPRARDEAVPPAGGDTPALPDSKRE
jgi:sec-independent protein translocase protein TatC